MTKEQSTKNLADSQIPSSIILYSYQQQYGTVTDTDTEHSQITIREQLRNERRVLGLHLCEDVGESENDSCNRVRAKYLD